MKRFKHITIEYIDGDFEERDNQLNEKVPENYQVYGSKCIYHNRTENGLQITELVYINFINFT